MSDSETQTGRWAAAELNPGTVLDERFRIDSVLGLGGMGVVYRARDLALDIDVAIKVLRPELAERPEAFERFRRELLLARQVSSPHVVRIHDIARHQAHWFISMDLVEGETLARRLDRQGPMPLPEALAIARQLAQGLAAAHAVGVIHRDLKPANVLIDAQGQARIADFGVARSLGNSGASATGVVVGTPDYLSPEQARGEAADARSDLYALGLILFEMLAGESPFAGLTAAESQSQRMWRAPPGVDALQGKQPIWVQRLLGRLLSPRPAHRLQSANAVLQAIDRQQVPRDWHAMLRRAMLVGASVMVIAMAVLVVHGLLQPRPDAPPDRVVLLPIPESLEPDPDRRAALAALFRLQLDATSGQVVVSSERTGLALSQLGLESAGEQLPTAVLEVLPARAVVTLRLEPEGREGRRMLVAERIAPGASPVRLGAMAWQGNAGPALQALAGAIAATSGDVWPKQPETLTAIGLALKARHRGGREDVVDLLQAAARHDPEVALVWLLLCEQALLTGQVELAIEAARRGADLKGSALAQRLAWWLWWLQGEEGAALEALGTWLASRPGDLDGRLWLAAWRSESGEFEVAESLLASLLASDEHDARAWFLRGKNAILRGQPRPAVEDYLLRALVLYTRARHRFGEAETVNALGVGYARLGQTAQAVDYYRKAVELRRGLGYQRGVASSLRNLGQLAMIQGQHDDAARSFEQARQIFESLGDAAGVSAINNEIGMLSEERGDYPAALAAYRTALRGRQATGDTQGVAESLNNTGYAHFQLGDYESAQVYWQQALEAFTAIGDDNGRLRAEQNLGLLATVRGDWAKAEHVLQQTLRRAQSRSLAEEAAVSHRNLAELLIWRGQLGLAAQHLRSARELFAERQDQRGLIDADLLMARLWYAAGVPAQAEERLQALAAEGEAVSLEQAALAALLAAEISLDREEPARAKAALARAREAAQRSGVAVLMAHAGLLSGDMPLASQWIEIERIGHLPLQLRGIRARLEQPENPGDALSVYREARLLLRGREDYVDASRLHRLGAQALAAQGDAQGSLEAIAKAERDEARLAEERSRLVAAETGAHDE